MKELTIDLNKPVSEKTVRISCQTAASCTETSSLFFPPRNSSRREGVNYLVSSCLLAAFEKKNKNTSRFGSLLSLSHWSLRTPVLLRISPGVSVLGGGKNLVIKSQMELLFYFSCKLTYNSPSQLHNCLIGRSRDIVVYTSPKPTTNLASNHVFSLQIPSAHRQTQPYTARRRNTHTDAEIHTQIHALQVRSAFLSDIL